MADAIGSRSLRELARVLFARWLVCLLIVVAIAAGTWVACVNARAHYRSSVKFQMREPRPRNPVAREVSPDRSLQVFIKSQQELMTSDPVLARVLLLMEYAEKQDPFYDRWSKARGDWGAGQFVTNGMAEQRWAGFETVLTELDKRIEERKRDKDHGAEFMEQIRRFARSVKVEAGEGGEEIALTETVTLTVTRPEPVEQAWIAADMVARNYLDRYRQLQWLSSKDAVKMMDARTIELRKARLDTVQATLSAFVEKLDEPSDLGILEQLTRSGTEAGKQILVRGLREDMLARSGELAELRQLQQQLLEQLPPALWGDKPRTDAEGLLTVPDYAVIDQMKDTDELLTDMVTTIPEKTIASNVVVKQLKTAEVTLLTDLNRLRVDYRDDYDEVQKKLTEIAKTRRLILKELVGEARTLHIPIAILTARQKETRTELEHLQDQLNRVTGKLFEYQSLVYEMSLARSEYEQASNDLASAKAGREQEAEGITILIIENAQLPDVNRPAFPKPLLYTVIAACVGLLLAVAYAFVADHFDHTFKSIEEAERYLGVPVVGSVPKCGGRLVT